MTSGELTNNLLRIYNSNGRANSHVAVETTALSHEIRITITQ